ncbi:MAG: hypothetical protein IPI06_09460 [Gammaproteobacteria bacterium]|nr:hypothetical protein [Gammaproteobacteria bacterium]
MPQVAYEGYEDIWRAKWRWDSVAKGTHFVNCWYQRGCNWNVYVKDGIVWREEQSGTYEPIDPKIPTTTPGLPERRVLLAAHVRRGAPASPPQAHR